MYKIYKTVFKNGQAQKPICLCSVKHYADVKNFVRDFISTHNLSAECMQEEATHNNTFDPYTVRVFAEDAKELFNSLVTKHLITLEKWNTPHWTIEHFNCEKAVCGVYTHYCYWRNAISTDSKLTNNCGLVEFSDVDTKIVFNWEEV